MKLKCPACGTPIPADQINVQQMIAVCPHCDNVFKFDSAFAPQRRKIKAPAQFRVVDDDPNRLDFAFHWSYRTEPPIGLFAIAFGMVITLLMLVGMIGEGAPFPTLLLPLAPITLLSYTLLTIAVNTTHYESDGEMLHIYTEPLPYFRYGEKSIQVDEIESVTVERPTYALVPEGKAGFYDVCLHTLDGDQVRIAAIVNYEHAHFIAQEIESYMRSLKELPALMLDDAPGEAEPELLDDVSSGESERKALRF